MNQIVKMFEESNARITKIMSGRYNREQIQDACREFQTQVKLVNSVISWYGITSKNKRGAVAMEKMNLLDDHTAIDLGVLPDNDKIKCPDNDTLILRSECLDYSGSHNDSCSGCDHFKTSRDKILGES